MPAIDRGLEEAAARSSASEAAVQGDIVVEGELRCLLVYSDRRHVGYINALLSQLESVLRRRGFKPLRLGEEIRTTEDYLEKLAEIVEESVLGVVILDGFRPNVLLEFGFLLGTGKPTIALVCKGACVSVKTLYASHAESGLSEKTFERRLLNPQIDLPKHLSDFAGKHVTRTDWTASEADPNHPSAVLARELDKSQKLIVEEAGRIMGRDMTSEDLAALREPLERSAEVLLKWMRAD